MLRFEGQAGSHGAVALVWAVSGASAVKLNGAAVGLSGQATLHVTALTTLTLAAVSKAGTVTQTLQVLPVIQGAPTVPPAKFLPTPPVIHRFEAVTDQHTH